MQTMMRSDWGSGFETAEGGVAPLTLRAAALIPSGCVPRFSGSYWLPSRLAPCQPKTGLRSSLTYLLNGLLAPEMAFPRLPGPVALVLFLLLSALPCLEAQESGKAPLSRQPSMAVGLAETGSAVPESLEPLAARAAVAVSQLDWAAALAIYDDLIAKAPAHALLHANRGTVLARMNRLETAVVEFDRAVRMDAELTSAWQSLGILHWRRGRLDLAVSALLRWVDLAPEDPEARIALAAAMTDRGWPTAALEELKTAVQIDRNLGAAHFNLAVAYLSQPRVRPEMALRHYQWALDLGEEPSLGLLKAIREAPATTRPSQREVQETNELAPLETTEQEQTKPTLPPPTR